MAHDFEAARLRRQASEEIGSEQRMEEMRRRVTAGRAEIASLLREITDRFVEAWRRTEGDRCAYSSEEFEVIDDAMRYASDQMLALFAETRTRR